MKKLARFIPLLLLLFYLPQSVSAARMLVPVGRVVGLELGNDRVYVAGFDEEVGEQTQAAGLRIGDELIQIDNVTVRSPEDVKEALDHARGSVAVRIRRGDEERTLRLTPGISADGPRLGIYLRRGVTGIGTVTWYDPETMTFGALGHGVNGVDGNLIEMVSGNAYEARIRSVRRGRVGQPGQLLGTITDPDPLGELTRNTVRGIFGTCEDGWEGGSLATGEAGEVRPGGATILSTVAGGEPREYSVEILKIYADGEESGRNLLLRITDPVLLEQTGGIVQGMSGSPIIQDGKLVGAVTHVLVNDPTTGYGIFIENMLDAAA